jgi:hypothetical protein
LIEGRKLERESISIYLKIRDVLEVGGLYGSVVRWTATGIAVIAGVFEKVGFLLDEPGLGIWWWRETLIAMLMLGPMMVMAVATLMLW